MNKGRESYAIDSPIFSSWWMVNNCEDIAPALDSIKRGVEPFPNYSRWMLQEKVENDTLGRVEIEANAQFFCIMHGHATVVLSPECRTVDPTPSDRMTGRWGRDREKRTSSIKKDHVWMLLASRVLSRASWRSHWCCWCRTKVVCSPQYWLCVRYYLSTSSTSVSN